MTVLVTGSTGFIGHGLVETLLERGVAVRCLVRSPAKAASLEDRGAQIVRGDLDAEGSLGGALDGVHAVIHLAGRVRAWTRESYFRTNAVGTQRLFLASREAGVGKFVLVSSMAALGPAPRGEEVSEGSSPRPVNAYGESKLAAERVIIDAPGGPAGLPAWCIVRPCCVYGPRDRDVLTLFRAVSRGIAPYSAPRDARLSLIHVDDLVDLVIRALETAAPGSSYMASDGLAHSWPELIAAMGRALGRRPLCVRIPPWALWPAALLLLLGRPFLDRPHVLCPDKLREARQHSWVASSTKARAELGWAPRRGLDEGVRATAEWYRRNGWI